jgi:siroheme synthase
VGKEAGHHTLPQEEINQLLVRLATAGRRVVRLKGGDPFIFGRAAKRWRSWRPACPSRWCRASPPPAAWRLRRHSLTHRDHAQSVVFATGHRRAGESALDWAALARPHQTAVIYMGVGQLAAHCAALVGHGRAAHPCGPRGERHHGPPAGGHRHPGEPAGTGPGGRHPAPALLIVGEVVSLAGKLSWFAGKAQCVAAATE